MQPFGRTIQLRARGGRAHADGKEACRAARGAGVRVVAPPGRGASLCREAAAVLQFRALTEQQVTLGELLGHLGQPHRRGGLLEFRAHPSTACAKALQCPRETSYLCEPTQPPQSAQDVQAAFDHPALHARQVTARGTAEDGGDDEVGLELLHLRHAVHKRAVRAHDAS